MPLSKISQNCLWEWVHFISQNDDEPKNKESQLSEQNEFARLRDILNTAKSECENMQLHKSVQPSHPTSKGSHSRTSSRERERTRARDDDPYKSTTRSIDKYNSSGHDIKDLYERINPYDTTGKPESRVEDKPWIKRNDTTRAAEKGPEPLAISTPRNAKSAEQSLYRTPKGASIVSHQASAAGTDDNKPASLVGSSVSMVAPNQHLAMATKGVANISGRSTYENPGNLRLSNPQEIPSKGNGYSTRKMTVDHRLQAEHNRLRTTSKDAGSTVSKTKEIVEIKNRNSTELDPSKCFKPINPDDEVLNTESSGLRKHQATSSYKSYLTGSAATSLTSSHKYYPLSTTSRTYDKPYKSKYETSSYKSRYTQDARLMSDDYRNVSADSAYGSPSRSFSKMSSVTSYKGSYHKDYGLPSITSSQARYTTKPESKDSLTKVPPLFTSRHLVTA